MERTDILELMSTLKLYGMRAAGACPRAGLRAEPGDEVMTTGIKRRHEPPRIVGDLLSAEIAEKQARSIKYQLTIAKLPLAKQKSIALGSIAEFACGESGFCVRDAHQTCRHSI